MQQSGHDNGQRIATEAVKGTVFVTFSSFYSLCLDKNPEQLSYGAETEQNEIFGDGEL